MAPIKVGPRLLRFNKARLRIKTRAKRSWFQGKKSMSDTYIGLDNARTEWKGLPTVKDWEKEERLSRNALERGNRPSVRLIGSDFRDNQKRSDVSARLGFPRREEQTPSKSNINQPPSYEKTSELNRPSKATNERPYFPKWLRAAFVSCVTAEVVSVGLVIATPFLNDRVITVSACGVSAIGLGVLAWMSSKVESLRSS